MPKPTKYHGGSYQRTTAGTYRGFVHHAYRKYRATFPNERQVRAWIDSTVHGIQDGETPLDALEQRAVRRALGRLPDGVTLDTVIDFYLRNGHQENSTLTVGAAYEGFLTAKRGNNLRPSSLEAIESYLGRFQRDHNEALLSAIDAQGIIQWIDRRQIKGANRRNQIVYIRQFFRWCVRSRFLMHDPTEAIDLPRKDQKLPGILSVKEGRALLEAAQEHDPDLCAYLGLGMFAGVRTAELNRLDWTAIRHSDNLIHIGAEVAKLRQQRFITLPENLAFILNVNGQTGPIAPDPIRQCMARRIQAIRRAAGIDTWPTNAMRHSYATYHLALHENAAKTAKELGHTNANMLYNHYRNLATAADGAAWFQIT